MLQMDSRLLHTLEAVVRTGSLAAAAAELGFSAPAVSQQIAELERRVGLRVLDRRPVRLTEAGRALLDAEVRIRAALSTLSAELDGVRDGTTGELRIGVFASAAATLLPAALAGLQREQPGVTVLVHQLETAASYRGLERGELDLAVTFDYPEDPLPAPPEGQYRSRIAVDPIVAVLPAGHRLAARDQVLLADLAGENWVQAPQAGLRLTHLQHLSRSAGFAHRIHYVGDDFHAVLGMVAAGLCVTLLPLLALQTTAARVVARPIAGDGMTREVFVTRLRTRHAPPVLDLLQQLLADVAGGVALSRATTVSPTAST